MIWEELKESLIFFDLEEKTDAELLKVMGQAMVRAGHGRTTYVQALIDREKIFPTGLDIEGIGVAIPHTDVCHVKKDGIALAVLRHPVEFRQMQEETLKTPVRFVFMLAVADAEEHLGNLQSILRIIQDRQTLQRLSRAKHPQEAIRIIREKEESA